MNDTQSLDLPKQKKINLRLKKPKKFKFWRNPEVHYKILKNSVKYCSRISYCRIIARKLQILYSFVNIYNLHRIK